MSDTSSAFTILSPDSIANATFSNAALVPLQSPSLCFTILASIVSSSSNERPLVFLLRWVISDDELGLFIQTLVAERITSHSLLAGHSFDSTRDVAII